MSEIKSAIYPSKDKPWTKYYREDAVNMKLPEKTVYEYLKDTSKGHEDDVCIVYFNKKITYRELFESIDKAFQAFSVMGVKKGDTVGIISVNTPEVFAAFYALNRIGAVAFMIDPRTNTARIEALLRNTDSHVVVILENAVRRAEIMYTNGAIDDAVVVSVADSMDTVTRLGYKLKTKGKKPEKPAQFKYWNEFLALADGKEHPEVSYEKDYPAVIDCTGGTTGIPKGAVLSNDSLNTVTIEYMNNGMSYGRGEKFLNIMPPFIAYGVATGLNMTLCIGLVNIIVPSFDPKEFGKLVMKYKPEHFIGVPMHFEKLIEDKKFQKADISFVKTAAAGGDSMNPVSEKRINEFFFSHGCKVEIIKGYGMTELGSAAATTQAGVNKPVSVGVPLPLMTASIHDPETGEELPCNTEGEMYMTGPSMMTGYVNNEEEFNNTCYIDENGVRWIKTGDIGYIDEDGFIFIKGRKKRVIVRPDGHNTWPSEMEAVLYEHPNVSECAVVGLPNPDKKGGMIPTAFVVPKSLRTLTDDDFREIDSFCKHRLPERDCPMAYRYIEALPMTPVGKVDYRTLEKSE